MLSAFLQRNGPRGLLTLMLFLLLAAGCAKTPTTANGGVGPQLFITMTVKGQINPADFYFVLFNVNNTAGVGGATGPIPVVASPWGNGFATGAITSFVEWTGNTYLFNVVNPADPTLRTYAPGQFALPNAVPPQTGGTTLQFQIPLSFLATASIPVASITSVQINFLATDAIPLDPYSGTKLFDALGTSNEVGSINDFISIPTMQSGVYQNSDKLLEPSGDVTQAGNGTFQTADNPDLDIVNWRVEVRD